MGEHDNNKEYCYPSTCQYCGQKVIRWGSKNSSMVVLNPYDLGMEGPHKYTCQGNNPHSPKWRRRIKIFVDKIFIEESSQEDYNINNMFI